MASNVLTSITNYLSALWSGNAEFYQAYIASGRAVLDASNIVFDSLFKIFLIIAIAFTTVYLIASLYVIFVYKPRKEKKFLAHKAPSVTIQIPTRNEIVALRCAKMCLDFDYPKDKFEIIIGDDSDKPLISKKIDEFAAKYANVRVLRRLKNIGFKPGNLNNMLKSTKNDIIVIFDSDFTPKPDLKRIVTPFIHDKNLSAVQAKWSFSNYNQNLVTLVGSSIVYIFHHIVLLFLEGKNNSSLCGSAEAVKRSDLIKLGGWTSGSLTEDIEYSLRLYKANKRIKYLPSLECENEVPYVAMDLYKQQMRWAYGVITSYKTHMLKLLFNKKTKTKNKFLSLFAGFGYVMPVLIVMLFLTGTLSFVTATPGPIDIPKFATETLRNILLTSGLILATIVALYREKKLKYGLKTLVASFSIGLVTTYFVNKGIIKAILGKPMQWFLLQKDPSLKKAK